MVNLTPSQALADIRRVNYIRVVVHAGAAIDGSDNHWSIYLLLQSGGSVRVNMVTDYGDINGRLEWTDLAYLLTTSAIQHWDFPVTMAIEVRHVADTIYRNRRHQYQFSGGGSGCRFWVRTIMYDLESPDRNYTAVGTSNELWQPLQYLYRRGKDPSRINWVEGTFY
ncbi:uncharacterized protein N7483_010146 [Penicillium malachiteum]|uniref:uncharacterized protein n=1 Tax=Penicillium malachiteum TaxID=1324776 RepID=UPI00254861E6|nr:uncharacterized protein N7483_010146 [Penicillium malachiteum]KAJ5712965.1 hypothetical protein N7483_010146 [Penicillium malachiteum]